jgi:hypothetical protein
MEHLLDAVSHAPCPCQVSKVLLRHNAGDVTNPHPVSAMAGQLFLGSGLRIHARPGTRKALTPPRFLQGGSNVTAAGQQEKERQIGF